MTRRLRRSAARLGLAALFALQAAMVAHAFALPAVGATQTTVAAPTGDCARMAAASTSDVDFKVNLCQVHCQPVVQVDATAFVALIAHVPPRALQVVVARDALPPSAWLAPLAAKNAFPPAQLLYARFLV
jgi:cytolysin (calcineurin-like family phosphatase)